MVAEMMEAAGAAGFPAVVIEGHPHHYCGAGFRGSKSLAVSDQAGRYPYSLLVSELEKDCLAGENWTFQPSEVYDLDMGGFETFEAGFPRKEKAWRPSQEVYRIASRCYVE